LTEIYYFSIPPIAWIIVAILAAVIIAVFIMILAPMLTCRLVIKPPCVSLKALVASSTTFCVEDVKGVKIVDKLDDGLKPVMRVWGMSLPGFRWGWFKLENGAKAFLAVAGAPEKYIVVELKNGEYVIMAPKKVDEVFKKLVSMGMNIEWK